MPQMDRSNFLLMSEAMLESLAEQIEESLDEDVTVDYQDSMLTITHETEGAFVIHPHMPTHQIWMASPISGSTHFAFVPQSGRWRSIRPPHVYLRDQLAEELSRITNKLFIFEAI
ncbi:MAG: iron donor protein CyaY [Alphaproteobacteria bacterium]|nr:MAG: iron donor protein CyaY [Alphaproteobacteria bacterium]